MANIRATSNGNWSNNSIWSPAPPASTDDVFASGFTVTVDQNIQVLSINTIGATGIGGGGNFRPNDGVVMTTNVVAGSSTCVTFINASPNTFTLVGNVTGGTSANAYGINNTSTGTVNVTGNCFAGTTTNCHGVSNTGIANVIGNVYGGSTSGSPAGISNSGVTATANVLGNVYSRTGGPGASNTGTLSITGSVFTLGATTSLSNSTSGTVIIFGSVFSTIGVGVNNTSVGPMTVIGDVYGGNTSANLFGVQNASTGTLTVSGNIYGGAGTSANGIRSVGAGIVNVIGSTYGGQGTSTAGISNNSTGTINLTGNCYGYGYIPIDPSLTVNGTGGYGINNVAGGTVNVIGNVYSSNRRGDAWGIYNQANGNVTVFGNAYGGPAPATGADGIRNISTSTGTIILSGTAYGGNGIASAYGVNNLSTTAIVRVKRAAGNNWGLGYTTAIASNPGVFGSQTGSTFVEELECGPRGQWPTGGVIFFTPNTKATSMFETNTFQNYSLIQSNSADNLLPSASSVRQGEVYDLGEIVGSCIIPPTSSVAYGVLVDNTTGILTLTPNNTWNFAMSGVTDDTSMGRRLKNSLNNQAANSLINSFNL